MRAIRASSPAAALLLLGAVAAALSGVATATAAAADSSTLLNVSYDPTRELYQDIDAAFSAQWKAAHGQDVTINQSHGGSGKQSRAVIDGLEADVVTLGLAYDIDVIASKAKLLPADWQDRLPDRSTPFTSTIVLVVRRGNPKGIHDWGDLIKPGVQVITANPKTSGGARWNYLAAWGWALRQNHGDEAKARDFITQLYQHVPVLDAGARGATSSFVERGLGDVLINWENEGLQITAKDKDGSSDFELVVPSASILAEPPVALVDQVVDKHGTRALAQAYLEFLFTPAGQEIGAKHFYRPRDPAVAAKYASQFPKLDLFTIDEVFGGWSKAQPTHFNDGGVFDQIYQPQ
jgi:sulfate transport system substrate-binding protein